MKQTYQQMANADVSAGLSEHNVHDQFKHMSVEQRQAICKRHQSCFDVMIVNVTGELNVGNIIRTASLCGARRVHIIGRRKFDSRGAVGSEQYLPVLRVDAMLNDTEVDVDEIGAYLLENKLYPIFVEQTKHSVPLDSVMLRGCKTYAMQLHRTPCFVFGNENRGVPSLLIERFCDSPSFELEQRGVIRSFNVGSTAAIVLYEAQRVWG